MSTCGCHDEKMTNTNTKIQIQKYKSKYKYKYKNTNTTNHFDICGLRESARDTDEEGGEDEKGGEIDSDNRLKEKVPENQGGDGDGNGEGGHDCPL